MKKKEIYLFSTVIVLWLVLTQSIFAFIGEIPDPPKDYYLVREQLIEYKNGDFRTYFGGPIDRKDGGVSWVMPVVFDNKKLNPRAVYEIAFINCTPETSENSPIIFVEASDIDIKLKNDLNGNYRLFAKLMDGKDKKKNVVVRLADTTMTAYPDVFIASVYSDARKKDKEMITKYLHEQYGTAETYTDLVGVKEDLPLEKTKNGLILYKPKKVSTCINGKFYTFYVKKIVNKKDCWGCYYVIMKKDDFKNTDNNSIPIVRIDSGCVSGQIYDDDACDCLDQMHDALRALIKEKDDNGMIIHIPTHDGRGFGTAPKAETEIYKRGGEGKIRKTKPLDTVTAAKLLYHVNDQAYDLRTFDGVAEIIKNMGYSKICLMTDNVRKVNSMKQYGIEVIRKSTETNKESCKLHLNAKKKDPMYFGN